MNEFSDRSTIVSTDPDERMWAAFCHLSTLLTLFPSANLIVPFLIWMFKKDRYSFVNDQGKEALNFQITIMIAYAVCVPLLCILGIPLIAVIGLYHVIFSIVAAIKSNEGRAYRYPVTLRLVT